MCNNAIKHFRTNKPIHKKKEEIQRLKSKSQYPTSIQGISGVGKAEFHETNQLISFSQNKKLGTANMYEFQLMDAKKKRKKWSTKFSNSQQKSIEISPCPEVKTPWTQLQSNFHRTHHKFLAGASELDEFSP